MTGMVDSVVLRDAVMDAISEWGKCAEFPFIVQANPFSCTMFETLSVTDSGFCKVLIKNCTQETQDRSGSYWETVTLRITLTTIAEVGELEREKIDLFAWWITNIMNLCREIKTCGYCWRETVVGRRDDELLINDLESRQDIYMTFFDVTFFRYALNISE
ncbi:MAG: hypothetical protein Q4D38_07915 [Planctomycetia bacterium]|nr:hypothetical protein [Planctomycetia bacterium]